MSNSTSASPGLLFTPPPQDMRRDKLGSFGAKLLLNAGPLFVEMLARSLTWDMQHCESLLLGRDEIIQHVQVPCCPSRFQRPVRCTRKTVTDARIRTDGAAGAEVCCCTLCRISSYYLQLVESMEVAHCWSLPWCICQYFRRRLVWGTQLESFCSPSRPASNWCGA
jgi:hypothetical protein